MKLINKPTFWVLSILISGYAYMLGCTHKDEALVQTAITRGDNVHLPGNLTAGNPDEWKLDKVHSSVLWQTTYVGAAGLLTGRFNQFGMADVSADKMIKYATTGQPLPDNDWAFYESDPSKTFFNGYVQINTSNTGEPRRDTGCNISTLGTTKIEAGVQNLEVDNLAKIESTGVQYDPESNDYLVTINLTWQGGLSAPLTKTITGKLKYIREQTVQFGTSAAYAVFGLQLSFELNCRDFGITSTSVGDLVQIICNMNFNNK